MWIVFGSGSNVYVGGSFLLSFNSDQSHNQGIARLTLTIYITPPNNLDMVTLEYLLA
jgi:hypothetical protein